MKFIQYTIYSSWDFFITFISMYFVQKLKIIEKYFVYRCSFSLYISWTRQYLPVILFGTNQKTNKLWMKCKRFISYVILLLEFEQNFVKIKQNFKFFAAYAAIMDFHQLFETLIFQILKGNFISILMRGNLFKYR